MAASRPSPHSTSATTRGETGTGPITPSATIDIDPTRTRMNVPISSARYFRASIRTSTPSRSTSTVRGQYRNSRWREQWAGRSGGDGERLRIGGELDRDEAFRALDAQ